MNDVELTATRAPFRIHLVTLPGCSDGSFFVESQGGKFGCCRVAWSADAIIVGVVVPGVGVPSLHDEVGHDPVERGAIIEPAPRQLYEIVPMSGRDIIQAHGHVAHGRDDFIQV